MSKFFQLITAGLNELDVAVGSAGTMCSPAFVERCVGFLEELSVHAARANLVGTTDPKRMVDELLIDSLQVVPALVAADVSPSMVVDIGSGAGIPGIPLLLHYVNATGSLVEPRMKRAMFLKHALRTTDVGSRAVVHRTRWEEAGIESNSADGPTLWVSRAVFQPAEWLERAAAASSSGDLVVAWLNEGAAEASPDAEVAGLRRLGSHRYMLEGDRARVVVVWRSDKAPPSRRTL